VSDESLVPTTRATTRTTLRDARDRVIARLSDAFAADELNDAELDERLTLAHRAESIAEVEALVEDLPAPVGPASPSVALAERPAPEPPTVPAANAGDRRTMVAVFGGVSRRGSWSPPRHLRIVAVMGGVDLDFRDARLQPGVTEVHVTAVMGGAHMIVPPQLAVEMDGIAIMGGFDHADRAPVQADPERPLLRIRGVAVMGGVSVETRLPGESRWAHRIRHVREQLGKALGPRRLPPRQLPPPKQPPDD
jgi:hypothetical protein